MPCSESPCSQASLRTWDAYGKDLARPLTGVLRCCERHARSGPISSRGMAELSPAATAASRQGATSESTEVRAGDRRAARPRSRHLAGDPGGRSGRCRARQGACPRVPEPQDDRAVPSSGIRERPRPRLGREAHRQVRHRGPRRRHARPVRAHPRRSPRHRRRLRQPQGLLGRRQERHLERPQERHPVDDDADRLQEPGAPGGTRRRQGHQGDRHPGRARRLPVGDRTRRSPTRSSPRASRPTRPRPDSTRSSTPPRARP